MTSDHDNDTNEGSIQKDQIRVSGIIVDETDNPVQSVRVEVFYYLDGLMSRETITDSRGRWQLALPAEASNVGVRLSHPDFISYHFDERGQREPSLAELKNGSCTLAMKRGLRITGKVSNQQGEPVENALVAAGKLYSFNDKGIGEDFTTARTAKDGSFAIGGLPAGKIDISVSAVGFSPKMIPVDMRKQTQPISIILNPGRTYRGRVTDQQGKAIEGMKVDNPRWKLGDNMRGLALKAITDSNGFFEIPDVPDEGVVEFIFHKRGSDWLHCSKVMPDDLSQLDQIEMPKIPVFAGKVLDAQTGNPIKHFETTSGCEYKNFNDRIHWGWGRETIDSPDGSFSVAWSGFCPQYPFDNIACLQIKSAGYLPAVIGPVKPGVELKLLLVRLVKADPLSGIVLDSQCKPAEGAQVTYIRAGERAYINGGKFDFQDFTDQPEFTAETNAQGRFELGPVEEQGIILIVHSAGWAQIDSNDFNNGSEIKLSRWARIEATLNRIDSSQEPHYILIEPADNEFDRSKPMILWGFTSSPVKPGRFVFENLPAMPMTVGRVIRWEFSDEEIINIEPGKTYSVTIGKSGCQVKGKITFPDPDYELADIGFADPRRVHAAAWRILPEETGIQTSQTNNFNWLYSDFGKSYKPSTTSQKRFVPRIDEKGNFTFDDLPPGRYEFVVNIHGPLAPNTCGRGELLAIAVAEFDVPDGIDQAPLSIPNLTAHRNLSLLQ